MHCGLAIGGEKIDVKHWMDAPLRGKLEAIIDCGHHLSDLEWAMPPGRKLCGWLVDPKVLAFQPHEVAFLVFGRITVFDP
jgi:hypothetical protein